MATTASQFKKTTIEEELKKLDEVLDYFRTYKEIGGVKFDSLMKEFDPTNEKNYGHQLRYLLEKLKRDIHIFEVESHPYSFYYITSEGKTFDGYYQKYINDNINRQNAIDQNQRMERNEVLLWVGTFSLAFVEMIKLWLEYSCH